MLDEQYIVYLLTIYQMSVEQYLVYSQLPTCRLSNILFVSAFVHVGLAVYCLSSCSYLSDKQYVKKISSWFWGDILEHNLHDPVFLYCMIMNLFLNSLLLHEEVLLEMYEFKLGIVHLAVGNSDASCRCYENCSSIHVVAHWHF